MMVAALAVLDPFAFFQPTLQFGAVERQSLLRGSAIARTVPAPDGNVGIVATVPVRIEPDRLVAWIRNIAALKRSPAVRQIGRFSETPSLADLSELTLDRVDLDDLARCRPSDCDVKLRPDEILRLRAAVDAAGRSKAARDVAVDAAFRTLVVARAEAYLRHGLSDGPEPPAFLGSNWPQLAEQVRSFPRGRPASSESFLYWSKDAYAGKPIISITHVTIVRGTRITEPEVLVIGRQVFATHYTDGAWSFTSLVRDDQATYLVYVNQSAVDLLNTWYGGLVRRTVEGRIRSEAVEVLGGLKRRLESGDPPPLA